MAKLVPRSAIRLILSQKVQNFLITHFHIKVTLSETTKPKYLSHILSFKILTNKKNSTFGRRIADKRLKIEKKRVACFYFTFFE